jgi:hypothetical protein
MAFQWKEQGPWESWSEVEMGASWEMVVPVLEGYREA